ASATSATSVVAFSQDAPTTNQAVTLVATVSSNSGNANPHGSLSFFNGATGVPGCTGKGVNGGQTITIVCQAAFPAGVAQISAAYLADSGSLVAGSSSDSTPVSVGKGATSVSLAVTPRVAPGGRATYVATLAVPASNAGPSLPSGSIEFLDRGQPIGTCASQALSDLTATCSMSYRSRGSHNISALYTGDSNFTGSTSTASRVQIVKGAAKTPTVRGSLGATLGWRVFYHPHYTELTELEAFAVHKGTSILIQCFGKSCPFAKRHLTKAAGRINLLSRFRHRRLRAGTRITVRLMRRHWVGKYYLLIIRPGRRPFTRTSCLAPGAVKPGVGCTTRSG
ncbi:MAG: Ig-like domain-containing protein, partial [Solirubrobacteraceae bacterium]